MQQFVLPSSRLAVDGTATTSWATSDARPALRFMCIVQPHAANCMQLIVFADLQFNVTMCNTTIDVSSELELPARIFSKVHLAGVLLALQSS